jgi:hypothetical protein
LRGQAVRLRVELAAAIGQRPVDRYVAAGRPALSAAAADFMDGLMARRWTWRQVPRLVRLELVRHTIGMLDRPTQAEFDAFKPDWMATAAAHAQTFGVPWSHLADLSRDIEVAA